MSGPRLSRLAVEISVPDLLRAAKAGAGIKSDADLARRLGDYGLDSVSTARSIPRWRKGETQPQYAAAIALLALAGWLNEDRIHGVGGLAEAAAQARTAEERARDLASPEVPLRDEPKSV